MSDSLVLLAKNFDPAKNDPTGWMASEKLDGCRSIWTGEYFISRNGNRFYAPEYFTKGLPNTTLDGELWMGRKMFQTAVSIIKSESKDKGWNKLKFCIFDMPKYKEPFTARYERMRKLNLNPQYHVIVPQTRCTGIKQLVEMTDKVVAQGGEGIMLRDPNSFYEQKRSSTLLKVKRFQDLEARVIGYIPGKGKHVGRMGALTVRWKNVEFEVGTGFTDYEREHPPKIGSTITVKFQELSDGGTPRFPSFLRVHPGF
jgi:DNA ligase 1